MNTYTMNANWQGQYSWQTGSNPVTTPLTINQGVGASSSISDDLSVPLPNSVIAITGTAKAVSFSCSPTSVIFNATVNGQLFTASASGGTFSATVPNLMTYKVEIGYSCSLGSGICNSGTLTVQAGVGVTSGTASASC